MADIVMPQLGETVTEGTITGWTKQIGDSVDEGETLFEVSTDKVDTEVPSAAAGVLTEILVAEGETVAVGATVARVGEAEAGETAASQPAASQPAASQPAASQAAVSASGAAAQPNGAAGGSGSDSGSGGGERRGLLSPVVRRLAREHGVNLDEVKGTGQGGRITRDDVLAFVEQRKKAQPAAAAAQAPAAAPAAPAAPPSPVAPAAVPAGGRVEAMSRVRAITAERTLASKQTAPHVFSVVEVDMERVARARARHKEAFAQRHGFSLTFLPFIACATVQALQEYPGVNASVDLQARTVTYHDNVHLGIAVDLDGAGLIIPVIAAVGGLGVTEMARRINDVATRARGKGLKPDEISGSTFTITNNGSFGSLLTAPVINQPNVAILSTELIEKRPVVIDDAIAIRHRMYLDMSWDHRALDGSVAARFLRRVKELLETTDWDARLAG
jgi:pyruvate dehydrogenase E2 component (dihydrolipoamide acetyltransferase)